MGARSDAKAQPSSRSKGRGDISGMFGNEKKADAYGFNFGYLDTRKME
jgi:hypothetical protein